MTVSVLLLCSWVCLAFVMAAIPSNDNHWRRAYVLMALGVPLLIFLVWENGPLMGLIGLAIGCSVFRWPVLYLWQWVRKKLKREP